MEIYTIGFTRKSASEFFEILRQRAIRRLIDIRLHNTSQLAAFTKRDDLKCVGRSSCGTDVGRGKASLGCFRPSDAPHLYHLKNGPSGKPAIRIRVGDDEDEFDALLGVTDLRLYQDDHMTPDRSVIRQVSQRIRVAQNVILGVGLTRAFATSSEPGSQSYHWLQVTNIHLEDDPTWGLG